MNPKLKAGLNLGLLFAKQLFPAIETVETAARGVASLKGKDKQQAAVNLILAAAHLEGDITGKELLSKEADAKLRIAVDRMVDFMNQVQADHAKALAPGGE